MLQSMGSQRVRRDWISEKQQPCEFAWKQIIFPLRPVMTMCCVLCLVAQLCPTLCNSVDCTPPGPSVHGDSPGKNTGVGCHALLQGIFPTQGLNPSLPHHRQILYHLSHQGTW